MRIVMTSLAVLALMACGQQADTTVENVAEENMAMDANAMDANAMATPAAFQINETTWEFTREGKAIDRDDRRQRQLCRLVGSRACRPWHGGR